MLSPSVKRPPQMMSEKNRSNHQIPLENDLEEDSQNREKETFFRSDYSSEQKERGKKRTRQKDDIIDKFLRSCYAIIPAIITGGVIAGMLEVAQGWVITAGSPSMVSLTFVSFFLWYWIIKRIDDRKKE
jgi:hypothetical protein